MSGFGATEPTPLLGMGSVVGVVIRVAGFGLTDFAVSPGMDPPVVL